MTTARPSGLLRERLTALLDRWEADGQGDLVSATAVRAALAADEPGLDVERRYREALRFIAENAEGWTGSRAAAEARAFLAAAEPPGLTSCHPNGEPCDICSAIFVDRSAAYQQGRKDVINADRPGLDVERLLDAVRAYGDARADVAYGRATRKAIDHAWDGLLRAANIPPLDARLTEPKP